MGRGVKRSIDEILAEIDGKIEKKQNEITALKAKRKEVEDSRSTEMAIKVIKAAADKGIPMDDVLTFIESK